MTLTALIKKGGLCKPAVDTPSPESIGTVAKVATVAAAATTGNDFDPAFIKSHPSASDAGLKKVNHLTRPNFITDDLLSEESVATVATVAGANKTPLEVVGIEINPNGVGASATAIPATAATDEVEAIITVWSRAVSFKLDPVRVREHCAALKLWGNQIGKGKLSGDQSN